MVKKDIFDYEFVDTSQIDYELTLKTKLDKKLMYFVFDNAKKDFLKKNPELTNDLNKFKVPDKIPLPEEMRRYSEIILKKVMVSVSALLKEDNINLLSAILHDGYFEKTDQGIMFCVTYKGMYKTLC